MVNLQNVIYVFELIPISRDPMVFLVIFSFGKSYISLKLHFFFLFGQ